MSSEEKEEVLAMRLKGQSVNEIAEYIGCSAAAISALCRRNGIYGRISGIWTVDLDKRLYDLWQEGVKASVIAEMLGRTYEAVIMRAYVLKKEGWGLKDRTRRKGSHW